MKSILNASSFTITKLDHEPGYRLAVGEVEVGVYRTKGQCLSVHDAIINAVRKVEGDIKVNHGLYEHYKRLADCCGDEGDDTFKTMYNTEFGIRLEGERS